MTVSITPAPLKGSINAITSKSAAHRAMICAALSEGVTELEINAFSDDIEATASCLTAMGSEIKREKNGLSIKGLDLSKNHDRIILDCRESGSTLRFLLPLACRGSFKEVEVLGKGRLPERPLSELCGVLEEHGAVFSSHKLPLGISNSALESGVFRLAGNISSQYISGLLFVLPLLGGDSEIQLTSPLQSSAYVDMTIDMQRRFGVNLERTDNGFLIKGNQKYISPKKIKVEGDWSNAAFFLAAGALGGEIRMSGLDLDSLQGDKEILNILKRYGADIRTDGAFICVKPSERRAFHADVSETPDLLPVLSVLGAFAAGETKLFNAARLRIKESDRLKTTAEMIRISGAHVTENHDSLLIKGGEAKATEATLDSYSDHRIPMSAAVMAIALNNVLTLTGAEAVRKSYPEFFTDYKKLGGVLNVIDNRQ